MRVEFATDLLERGAADRLLLLGILAFGANGRHRVLAADRPRYDAWVECLGDPELRDEVRLVFDEGERLEALGARSQGLEVAVDSANSVSLVFAFTLLGYPLRVLLENGRTDRDFLLAFADSATREKLEVAERNGWILFETGGGIGEVRKRLVEFAPSPWARDRVYCVVDSDARAPGAISDGADKVISMLEDLASESALTVPEIGTVLSRRAVENYVDAQVLKRWLCTRLGQAAASKAIRRWERSRDAGESEVRGKTGPVGSYLRALFAVLALEKAPPVVWDHLDFSDGRGEKGNRTAASIWEQLSPLAQSVLERGFTKPLLREFFAEQTDMSDTTGEIRPILNTILERA